MCALNVFLTVVTWCDLFLIWGTCCLSIKICVFVSDADLLSYPENPVARVYAYSRSALRIEIQPQDKGGVDFLRSFSVFLFEGLVFWLDPVQLLHFL